MAFGNEHCEYKSLSCGEQPNPPRTRFKRDNPHAHVNSLIDSGGKLARPINSKLGNRIGLTVEVLGDTVGVSDALKAILSRHGVSFKATEWESIDFSQHDEDTIYRIHFYDIPTSQVASLGKAVAEINNERSKQGGLVER